MATTTRYSLTKPTVGADAGAWGGYLNANLDTIDATLWNLDNAAVKTDQLTLDGATSGSIVVVAAAVASGTLTLPAATDTLVGKATTDTFTNKTFDTAGTGNVLRINGTQVSAVTGTGSVVLATSPTLVTPLLGTPTSGTLTNCTGLPVSTGISGLGANVATFLATPSSANLANAVTDETGTGALVFGTSPTIATPTITTSAVIPLVNGGTTASSTLTLQSTSGAGTSDAILFKTGSQQERMRITTSGAVGIGVTPSYTFEVRDAGSNSSIAISNSGATGELLSTITNATGVATISSLKQLSVSVENAEPLIFKTTGSERMRIDSSGNVGIGTSSTGFNSAGLPLVIGSGSGNTGMTIYSGSSSFGSLHFADTVTTGGGSYSGYINYSHNTNSMQFGTNAIEAMRIDSSNRVGIGTTGPESKLHIAGSAGSPSISAANQIVTVHASTNGNGQTLQIGALTTAPWSTWIQGSYSNNPGFASPISLQPAGGDVGIGTSSPAGKLDIVTGVYRGYFDDAAGSLFRLSAVNAANSAYGPLSVNGSVVTFQISASEKMRIDSSGNVGIGTSSLFSKFTVSTSGENFELNPGLASVWDGGVIEYINRTSPGTRPNFNILTAGAFKVYTGGSNERMRIDSSGNVSINTSTSGSKLQVVGTASLGPGSLNSFGSGFNVTVTGAYGKATALDNTNLALMSNDALVNQPLTMTMSVVGDSTATSRYGYISINEYSTGNWRNLALQPFGGNVGIGTSSPSEALGVNGTVGIGNQATTGTAGALRIVCTGGANYIQSGQNKTTSSAAPLIFTSMLAGSEWMRIDSSGNVGIGTSSVATKLVVLDANRVVDTSGNVNIYTSDNQAAGLGGVLGLGGKNGSGATDPYVFATLRGAKENSTSSNYAGYMSMHTTTSAGVVTERMRIDSVGNVKVGGTADRATTAGTNQVVIFNGTAPVGTLANGCSFYSTAGEMRVMDAAGNATLLSPHDSVTNEWIYDSSHTPSGKRLKINVERLLRFINDHFGLDCVHDLMEEA